MIRNYTISSLKALKELPSLDVAQFTINSRIFPSNRKTVEMLRALSPYHDTDIIIHYDFIYILSRFKYFSLGLQNAILQEFSSIISYANTDKRIKGIISHTDFGIARDCYVPTFNKEKITDKYKGSIWNAESIVNSDINHFTADSLDYFYQRFKQYYSGSIGCKIYLENTTKVSMCSNEGTVDFIVCYLNQHEEQKELYGLCWDTEHDYAVTGRFMNVNDVDSIIDQKISLIVHLNTIPLEVTPHSMKDKHSFTTISECSVNSFDYYNYLADYLNANKILFVREVKEETMFREMGIVK